VNGYLIRRKQLGTHGKETFNDTKWFIYTLPTNLIILYKDQTQTCKSVDYYFFISYIRVERQ